MTPPCEEATSALHASDRLYRSHSEFSDSDVSMVLRVSAGERSLTGCLRSSSGLLPVMVGQYKRGAPDLCHQTHQ